MPLPVDTKVSAGQSIYYGVRPERMITEKSTQQREAIDGAVGEVKVVEPTGPEIHLYSKLGSVDICSITRDRVEWEPGDTVVFKPDVEHIHVFDGDSGVAV